MAPKPNPSRSDLAEGTRRRKLVAALSEQADEALAEFTRMLAAGEIDPDAAIRDGQDIFIEAAVTPKGLRELGYGG